MIFKMPKFQRDFVTDTSTVYVINIRTDRGLSKNAFFLQYISNDLSVMSLWNSIHVLLVSRFYKYKHAYSCFTHVKKVINVGQLGRLDSQQINHLICVHFMICCVKQLTIIKQRKNRYILHFKFGYSPIFI